MRSPPSASCAAPCGLSGTSGDIAPPVAVVDVGSNSVRLFLWEGTDDAGPVGPRLTTVTGLRRKAGRDGTIARDALSRLSACAATYGEMMRARGVERGVALGTSAVRDAPNRSAVAKIIGDQLGLPLTIVSGTVEARLAYAGARLAVDDAGPAIVLDVGGGSTELVRGDAVRPDRRSEPADRRGALDRGVSGRRPAASG